MTVRQQITYRQTSSFAAWQRNTLAIMSTLLDEAVKILRELPEDVQAAAARAIIEYSQGNDVVL